MKYFLQYFISRAALTLTPQAVQRVKDLTQGVPDCLGLRIGVKQRGCNGMSYTLDYANKKEKFDEIVAQDGVNIFIDKKAQLSILGKPSGNRLDYFVFTIFLFTGTEMDFIETKLSSEFVFNNPNITGTCGCGESFSL